MNVAPAAGESSKLSTGAARNWGHFALMVMPWIAVAIAFDWLATTFPTFHGSDETLFHYPAIQGFFAQLPYPDVSDYSSATGPLFHLLSALAAKVVGLSLQSLRLVNMVVSLAAVFVFYSLVARAAPRNEALVLALLFGISPYFFGASFLVLTDNIGILFALLSVHALFRSWETNQARYWIALCFWICLATLTRQLYAWLAVGAVLAMFVRGEPLRSAAFKIVGLAIAGLPLAGLVLLWGGLTPPSFQQQHVAASIITPRAGVFGVCVFGLYWMAIFPDRFISALHQVRSMNFLPLAVIITLTFFILIVIPTSPQDGDNGIVWRISRMTPELFGTRVVFWLLLPVGLLFFWNALRSDDSVSVCTALLALAFLVCNLPNAMVFEKYYDPLTIALLILIEIRAQTRRSLASFSRPLLLLAFAIYPVISWRFFNSA